MKTMNLHISLGLTLVLFISALSTSIVTAQTTPFPFEDFTGIPRIYNLDARSIALGESGIADIGQFTAFSINPALLSVTPYKNSFHINAYQNWQNNLMGYDLTLPALSAGAHTGVIRFGYFDAGFGEINPLGSNRQPEPNLTMYQVDAGYSLALSSVFSIGVLQTVSYAENERAQFSTYSVNTGLMYDPDGAISYALTVDGIGRSVKYQFIEDGTTVLGSRNIPVSLQIGATFRYPIDDEEPSVSISLANEKRFGEQGLWYKGGLEVKPMPYLALRSGLLFQPEDLTYIPRFGIGFHLQRFHLDYAASPILFQDERFHLLGLTYHF
jgi:hypothetical protein